MRQKTALKSPPFEKKHPPFTRGAAGLVVVDTENPTTYSLKKATSMSNLPKSLKEVK